MAFDSSSRISGNIEGFRTNVWDYYFKKPVDKAPERKTYVVDHIRTYFYKAEWYEVYDIIEELIKEFSKKDYHAEMDNVEVALNSVLQREFSAYRLINNQIVPITNETEIVTITEAEELTSQFTSLKGANIHLQVAVKLLSDRNSPNYRNSIKESISAVESMVKVVSGNEKDSLGAAIDKIKGKLRIHASLERSFKQLYGYTSDADGIRHALMDESSCDFEDAKYMLVSCSAFINYLIVKADKAGILVT